MWKREKEKKKEEERKKKPFTKARLLQRRLEIDRGTKRLLLLLLKLLRLLLLMKILRSGTVYDVHKQSKTTGRTLTPCMKNTTVTITVITMGNMVNMESMENMESTVTMEIMI